MPYPSIIGLGTAVPKYYYTQTEIYNGLAPALNNRRAPAVFRATEIESRHSALDTPEWLVANPSNKTRLKKYIEAAFPLGIQAINQALNQANLSPTDINDFIVVSCTGVDTPGLDVIIAKELDMSPYLQRSTIIGMGCHGLMPGLHRAKTAILAQPQSKVLVLTLELCTLHFQHDSGIRNILGSALFADGASAAVVSNNQNNGLQLIDSLSYSNYQNQEEMSFHPGDAGYVIYLSTHIPKLLRVQVPPLLEDFLARNQMQINNIKHWIVHPGGMRILDYIEQALELNPDELQYSRAILRQYGNMSSATLLFVLERLINQAQPTAGDYGIMLGFGPGLTIELGLVRW